MVNQEFWPSFDIFNASQMSELNIDDKYNFIWNKGENFLCANVPSKNYLFAKSYFKNKSFLFFMIIRV